MTMTPSKLSLADAYLNHFLDEVVTGHASVDEHIRISTLTIGLKLLPYLAKT